MSGDVVYQAEAALVGACLLGRRHLEAAVASGVRAEHFSMPDLAVLYEILEGFCLFGEGEPDAVWVKSRLVRSRAFRRDSAEAESLIVRCMEACPAPSNVLHYAELVRDFHRRRTVAETARKIASLAEQGQAFEAAVAELNSDPEDFPPVLLSQISRPNKSGLPTGFQQIDEATGFGIPRGQTTLVTARTKHGKSALMLQMAVEGCRLDGVPTLWFTLADLPPEILRERIERRVPDVSDLPFYVCSGKGGRTAERICARIRHAASTLDVGRVVVDYAQKVSVENQKLTPLEQATRASQLLAETAEQTNCALVVGSQITEHERGHSTKGARAWQEDAALEIVIRRDPDALELQPGRFSAARQIPVRWDPERLGFQPE